MCLAKVSRLEVIILSVSLCIFFVSCVCVCVAWLISYKKSNADVIAVMCVSFKYFTRYLTEASEVCMCVTVSLYRNE